MFMFLYWYERLWPGSRMHGVDSWSLRLPIGQFELGLLRAYRLSLPVEGPRSGTVWRRKNWENICQTERTSSVHSRTKVAGASPALLQRPGSDWSTSHQEYCRWTQRRYISPTVRFNRLTATVAIWVQLKSILWDVTNVLCLTILPAARHKRAHPVLTPVSKAGTRFT